MSTAPTYAECVSLCRLTITINLDKAMDLASRPGRTYTRKQWKESLTEGLARYPEFQDALTLMEPPKPADISGEVLADIASHPDTGANAIYKRVHHGKQRVHDALMMLLETGKATRNRYGRNPWKWTVV